MSLPMHALCRGSWCQALGDARGWCKGSGLNHETCFESVRACPPAPQVGPGEAAGLEGGQAFLRAQHRGNKSLPTYAPTQALENQLALRTSKPFMHAALREFWAILPAHPRRPWRSSWCWARRSASQAEDSGTLYARSIEGILSYPACAPTQALEKLMPGAEVRKPGWGLWNLVRTQHWGNSSLPTCAPTQALEKQLMSGAEDRKRLVQKMDHMQQEMLMVQEKVGRWLCLYFVKCSVHTDHSCFHPFLWYWSE